MFYGHEHSLWKERAIRIICYVCSLTNPNEISWSHEIVSIVDKVNVIYRFSDTQQRCEKMKATFDMKRFAPLFNNFPIFKSGALRKDVHLADREKYFRWIVAWFPNLWLARIGCGVCSDEEVKKLTFCVRFSRQHFLRFSKKTHVCVWLWGSQSTPPVHTSWTRPVARKSAALRLSHALNLFWP